MLNDERDNLRLKNLEEKDSTEFKLKGGYSRIFPVQDQPDL